MQNTSIIKLSIDVQAMDAIRASKGAEEARKHAATLQRLTAATRASMEQHVRAEEQEVRPEHTLYVKSQMPEHLQGFFGRAPHNALWRAGQRHHVLQSISPS